MLDNLRELILIADSTQVTTVATHIKARGTDFWGSGEQMNALIRKAREQGLPVYADQYPYNTSGTDGRIVLLPSWATSAGEGEPASAEDVESTPDYARRVQKILDDEARASSLRRDIAYEITRRGGAKNILIVEHPDSQWVGRTLADMADDTDVDPVDAAIALQLHGDRARRGGARLRAFSMSESDVETLAATPWTATSSDAGIALPSDDPVHPRYYGAFPRKIRHYALERQIMSVEDAVRMATSLPAEILQLPERGVVREGFVADLVVFDPQRIRDRADAFHPHRYPEGIDYVFVDGKPVVEQERWLGCLAGRVLTRPSSNTTATR